MIWTGKLTLGLSAIPGLYIAGAVLNGAMGPSSYDHFSMILILWAFLAVFFSLPLWLVLRALDWIGGGPQWRYFQHQQRRVTAIGLTRYPSP